MKSPPTVDSFLATLDSPHLPTIHALRAVIRSASPEIGEGIKWNAPSFHTTEHFATMRISGPRPLQLILHLGAKKSAMPAGAIEDPTGLLTWLGPDRAVIPFAGPEAVADSADALRELLRQWMRYVPGGAISSTVGK